MSGSARHRGKVARCCHSKRSPRDSVGGHPRTDLVLTAVEEEEMKQCAVHDIAVTIASEESISAAYCAAVRAHRVLVHVKVDTGMHQLRGCFSLC